MPVDVKNTKILPFALTIFGATGDLSRKRIFPSLYKLFIAKLLPDNFKILATARSNYTSLEFRQIVCEIVGASSEVTKDQWHDFSKKIDYISADVAEDIDLAKIKTAISDFEKEIKTCVIRIFYLAISPVIFEKAIDAFGKNKLYLSCQVHSTLGKPRVIIEKPFGYDLKSAQNIDNKLDKYLSEEQIYRIDHYLGKETVQNIFAFRFGNELFEPVWNSRYIDNVQITTAEDIGVLGRGEYYDKTGALRDIVQNHQLQLLTLCTMDEPERFEYGNIRKNKLAVLRKIKKMSAFEIANATIRGQYEGYLKEEKIAPGSKTESYALVKLFIDNERWRGVPFYLRTGKKLPGKITSIIVAFKERGHVLFENFWDKPMPNHITIQIQPNEGVGIQLIAKRPGLATILEPVDMEFCYKTSFNVPTPDAYERLLLDVIFGDQSLFISQEEIEASWEVIDPIRKVWDENKLKLEKYEPGTWGPEGAEKLIEGDSRRWLAPLLTVCKI